MMSCILEKNKKVLLYFTALFFIVFFTALIPAKVNAETKQITILHTNDTHGRVFPDPNNDGMIGIDKIAAMKEDMPGSLLIDAGDTLHGLPIAGINRGENIIELMKMAGYDVMVPGNHDFNYGSGRLLELAETAKSGENGFEIISANIKKKADYSSFLPDTIIKTADGVKVGLFGLSTMETPITANPLFVDTLNFADYKEEAQKAIAKLKGEGAEIIIGVAHAGREECRKLAGELGNEVDIIIDAHDHLNTHEVENGVLLTSSGDHGSNLGVVTIGMNEAGKILWKSASLITKDSMSDIQPVDSITKAANEMWEEVELMFREKIGTSAQFLSSARGDAAAPGVRTAEMPLGNLVADSLRAGMDADISVFGGGSIRADIKEGDITVGDVNSLLPFGNFGVVKTVTPAQLKEILENSVSKLPEADGRFLQISGMKFEYTLMNDPGNRVLSITVGDKKCDMTDTVTKYSMATIDYMANGGDGYSMIQPLPTVSEGDSMDVIFENYIKELCKDDKSVVAVSEGRIIKQNVLPVYRITANAGAHGQITGAGEVAFGKDKTLTITPKKGYQIAVVKINGVVLPNKPTVYTFKNVRSDQNIEVTFSAIKVNSIKINKKKATLKVGKKLRLKVTVKPKGALNKKCKWKSSNKKYASVTQKGVVKALRKRKKVTITAITKDGSKLKVTCVLKIKK